MKELLISQDMWEIVEKSFEMTNYWIILTSTKSAQFDGLKIRDSFFSSLNIREVDENTFDIIGGATTKCAWDIL